jgi:hypothetical protein
MSGLALYYAGVQGPHFDRDALAWYPKQEVFLGWLVHHQIAVRVRRGVYASHPYCRDFAYLPVRLRVYRIGKLILEREGHEDIEPPGKPKPPNTSIAGKGCRFGTWREVSRDF